MIVDGSSIHNGDCMTNDGGYGESLDPAPARPRPRSKPVWWIHGTPYSAGRITQRQRDWCLSAPAPGMVDGAHLTVQHCGAHRLRPDVEGSG